MHKLIVATAAALCVAGGAQAATQFESVLNAAQIVGTSTSAATGFVSATLVGGPGTWSFQYVATISGLDFGVNFLGLAPTGADIARNFHIMSGVRGANGPLLYSVRLPDREQGMEPLVELIGTNEVRITGSWDLIDGDPAAAAGAPSAVGNLNTFGPVMAAALAGTEVPLYIDVHTDLFPGAAIRGQIMAVPEPGTYALMLGGLGLMGFMARRRRQG